MKKLIQKYGTISLNSIALLLSVVFAFSHFHDVTLVNVLLVCCMLIAGYILGSLTCHGHSSKATAWITVFIFALLNILHSIIDGTVMLEHETFSQIIAVVSHEIARQPALIIILLGLLSDAPRVSTRSKIIAVILAVPISWILGMFIGIEFSRLSTDLHWAHPILEFGIFVFIGDILHHIKEDIDRLQHKHDCCHE